MAMRRIVAVLGLVLLGGAGLVSGGPAWARTPKPTITGLAASPTTVTTPLGQSTISASVANATSCTLSAVPDLVSGTGPVTCSGGTVDQVLTFPYNSSPKPKKGLGYKLTLSATGPGGTKTKKASVKVLPGAGGTALSGAKAVVSDGDDTYCALLTSGGVDCWGRGYYGDLGNGSSSYSGTAAPVQVEGVGGTGTLGGVTSLAGDGGGSFCALLTSGGVDCWGHGEYGELGDGTFYTSYPLGSPTPVQVEGVGGAGTLSGVASITDNGGDSYCALLTTSGVECWGYGYYGELGDGAFYTTGDSGSATPVQVEGVGGAGTLSGVASITDDGWFSDCALLASGGVDCWGSGSYGALGDGAFSNGATPAPVEDVGGTGTLGGVASLAGDSYASFCALLASGGVDCWGYGNYGELGDGTFYTQSQAYGSSMPVQVEGISGTGTLSGVTSLTDDGASSFCALLISGGVDCWGYGYDGQLGNGTFYNLGSPWGSATPVQVEGVGGTGTLGGAASLADDGTSSYCALLTSGGVDCWGYGYYGGLGNGLFYNNSWNRGSATPVEVEGVGGIGTLTGVTLLTGDGAGSDCAVLSSGGVDCWGFGYYGDLGNGTFYTTGNKGIATPVQVLSP